MNLILATIHLVIVFSVMLKYPYNFFNDIEVCLVLYCNEPGARKTSMIIGYRCWPGKNIDAFPVLIETI